MEISGNDVIDNFKVNGLECNKGSTKINFFICEDSEDLGLFFTKIKFEGVDKKKIAKKIEDKYKQQLSSKIERIELDNKVSQLYGMKNLAISIPALTFQNKKIKVILYSIPKDVESLISFDDFPMSKLTKTEISMLKSAKSAYEKDVENTIQKVRYEYPSASLDFIEENLKKLNLKMKFKNLEEFRLYMRQQQISTIDYKRFLKTKGLSPDAIYPRDFAPSRPGPG